MNTAEIFKAIFKEIFFPYLAADLERLCLVLRQRARTSHIIFRIVGEGERRTACATSTSGLVGKINVPHGVFELFARSEYVTRTGLGEELLAMARGAGAFSIAEMGDNLIWDEQSLWPAAYSTLFQQLGAVRDLHKALIERRFAQNKDAGAVYDLISEYPRQLPTHVHYAMASLGAWLGGAMNVQYFGFYATQPQIRNRRINRDYGQRIGYTPDQANELDASGIIALPASLVAPLLEAQGSSQVLGSISIDEFNIANFPEAAVVARKVGVGLPGLIMDRNYRTPFFARTLGKHALYGPRDVLRDHYTEFYGSVKPTSFVRCKHYCAPVIEVASVDEIREVTGRVPNRSKDGLFFRGQTSFYALQRSPSAQQLLFGDSCSLEPSLVTSAARETEYDYDSMHFILKYFLEQKLLAADAGRYDQWRDQLVSALCPIDYALMALSQHYGLPSHGLDVTTSIDVAIWFATLKYSRDVATGIAWYRALDAQNWPAEAAKWPVIFVCQCVTHSTSQSLHDCKELDAFGFRAERPERQHARFFLGGHSDHQNRLAETLVCVLRLQPGAYRTDATFESLFPAPADDPAYRMMLEFAQDREFAPLAQRYINRFHAA